MHLSSAEEFLHERVTVVFQEHHVIRGEVVGIDEQGIIIKDSLKNLVPIDFETISHIGRILLP